MFTDGVLHNNHLSLAEGHCNCDDSPLRHILSNAFYPSLRAIVCAKVTSSSCLLFRFLESFNSFSPQNMHMWVLEAESLMVILDDITTNKEFV